jgi:hypothetical protein
LRKSLTPLLLLGLLSTACRLYAQDPSSSSAASPTSTNESARIPESPRSEGRPDVAGAQDQTQKGAETKAGQAGAELQTPQPSVHPDVVDPFSIGHLPTSQSKGPMSVGEKFAYFEKPVFGPRAMFMTAFRTGLFMANPTSGYPREWRDGAGAFGRNYGNQYARSAAMSFARFASDALLHEDLRYSRSRSKSFFARAGHALGFTFIDKTDGGHPTLAFSNFGGAAAAGFMGNGYLPDGWNNTTHAGQRSLAAFGGFAMQNLAHEFAPEIGHALHHLHLPKLPLPPVWWSH